MKRINWTIGLIMLVLVFTTGIQADVFNMGGGQTSLNTVRVGDANNIGELSGSGAGGYGPDRICGAVNYKYNIGKYEVTAGQYTAFLNAVAKTDMYGLYNPAMADPTEHVWGEPWLQGWGCNIQRTGSSGSYTYTVGNGSPTDVANWANRPVNYVSFWDSCRFANWLHNGQPTGAQGAGTTETGAYTLTSNGMNNNTIVRNTDWKWAVTSEDEWYKAAYYKGGSTNAGYFDFPTSSDSIDTSKANYNWSVGHTTDVGFYAASSPYGTFDQGGNLWEWTEAVTYDSVRGTRGGSFGNTGESESEIALRAPYRQGLRPPVDELLVVGFRVSEVPEPASMAILALGGLALLRRRNS